MVWRFRSGKIDRILDYCVYPPARMVECALWFVPFTRASSGGLAGKRAAVCLRLAEPSSADPRQAEQRSEPEGPRSRVPRGFREALTHFIRPLRVIQHADARRDVQPIVVLLASSATLSDACLSARPAGLSGRSALCVVISRQVPTCLRNHALIADRPERQRACEVG